MLFGTWGRDEQGELIHRSLTGNLLRFVDRLEVCPICSEVDCFRTLWRKEILSDSEGDMEMEDVEEAEEWEVEKERHPETALRSWCVSSPS